MEMIYTLNGIISTFFIKCSSILTFFFSIFLKFHEVYNSIVYTANDGHHIKIDNNIDNIDKIKKVASFSSTEIVTLVILKD